MVPSFGGWTERSRNTSFTGSKKSGLRKLRGFFGRGRSDDASAAGEGGREVGVS